MTDFQGLEDEEKLQFLLTKDYDDDLDDEEELEKELDKYLAEARIDNKDYYALFNLNKNCTLDEIKEAYKRSSRLFHPDKHSDPEKRKLAQSQFQYLQKAYEVLSDPNTRAIYDTYGEKGLTMPWTVGHSLKTPEQLRKEYEKMAQKKREQDLENLVKTKTSIDIQADASPFFHYSPSIRSFEYGMRKSSVQRIFMKHSYHSQINDTMQLTLVGTVLAQQGKGGGNVGVNIRHAISPKLTLEYGTSLIKSRVINLKSYYQPTPDSFINTRTSIARFNAPPSSIITVGRQLSESVTGFINYNTGNYNLGRWGAHRKLQPNSSLSIGIASQKQEQEYQAEFQVGMQESHISLFYKKKIDSRNKLIATSTLSNGSGVSSGLGIQQKILPKTSLEATLNIGYPTGISIKFGVNRLGQSFSLPIAISNGINLNTLLITTIVPISSWVLFNELVLSPWRKNKIKNKLKELRELNHDYLDAKKREAIDTQILFKDNLTRRIEAEKEKNGLIIQQAYYGKFDSAAPELNENCIDVTLALQNLVLESQLNISSGSSKVNYKYIIKLLINIVSPISLDFMIHVLVNLKNFL
ncbi:DnaJ-domain-containing protein [Neoconidiobolus thromboides FSU 785]|nr:DnaJ-domain-containing protein [Neoconidiobolus thromboides FSU 785]